MDDSGSINGIFQYFEDGFTVKLKTNRTVLWKEIEKIQGYKLDLFTTDEICLDIFLPETIITISESAEGFMEFLEMLQNEFPSFDKSWYEKIIQPPFATNLTILYEKI